MILFIIMIALIIGIIIGLYFKISIVLFLLILFLVNIIVIKIKKIKNKRISIYIRIIFTIENIICFISFISIGFIMIRLYENSFENKYKDILETDVNLVGAIISNVKEKEYKNQYIIKVENINNSNKYKGTYLLLNTKNKNTVLNYGDKIEVNVKIELGEQQRNTGGFDYRFYLKTKKIYGIAQSEDKNIKIMKKNNVNIISLFANKVSSKIKKQANKLLNKEQASILIAILIGDKNEISDDVKENFRNSSLTHMLAISGSHVSYVLLGITFIIKNIKIHKRISKILTIIFLLFFILITGKTPSVMRACFMTIYVLIGSILFKRVSVVSSLSISMICILILNPYSLFDIGLQLSYGGTLGIIYFYPIIKRILILKFQNKIKNKFAEYIVNILLISLSANIFIFPIIMLNFNTLSLTFLISNLLAGPIMGVIVILGFITIMTSLVIYPLGKILSFILMAFIYLFSKVAYTCANLPLSKILVKTPSIYTVIFYYIILIFIIIKQNNKFKIIHKLKYKINKLKNLIYKNNYPIILLLVIFCVIIISETYMCNKKLHIYFIDVGQGDSCLVVTPNKKTILIDGGGNRDNELFDVGKETLIPYLLDRKIKTIDYCIISHFDSDHCRRNTYCIRRIKCKACNYRKTI